jgi:hypothetical protein
MFCVPASLHGLFVYVEFAWPLGLLVCLSPLWALSGQLLEQWSEAVCY